VKKVVIQCAATKAPGAGFFETEAGQRVKFVARPEEAPDSREWLYARPDDPSDVPEQSWRMRLEAYNAAGDNPFGLLEAYRLYRHPVYRELVRGLSVSNVFILSAGWGLVRADYPLPLYDITVVKPAKSADNYKWRQPTDNYHDFCHLHADDPGPIILMAGRAYLGLFQELTDILTFEKIVFYASDSPPSQSGWRTIRFRKSTNWQYSCARAFLAGEVAI
jgi:hypothetical protein